MEEEGNFLLLEADGQYEESGKRELLIKVESSLDVESYEATEDKYGSFWVGRIFMGRMGISFRVGIKLGWFPGGFWDGFGWILYGLFGEI